MNKSPWKTAMLSFGEFPETVLLTTEGSPRNRHCIPSRRHCKSIFQGRRIRCSGGKCQGILSKKSSVEQSKCLTNEFTIFSTNWSLFWLLCFPRVELYIDGTGLSVCVLFLVDHGHLVLIIVLHSIGPGEYLVSSKVTLRPVGKNLGRF